MANFLGSIVTSTAHALLGVVHAVVGEFHFGLQENRFSLLREGEQPRATLDRLMQMLRELPEDDKVKRLYDLFSELVGISEENYHKWKREYLKHDSNKLCFSVDLEEESILWGLDDIGVLGEGHARPYFVLKCHVPDGPIAFSLIIQQALPGHRKPNPVMVYTYPSQELPHDSPFFNTDRVHDGNFEELLQALRNLCAGQQVGGLYLDDRSQKAAVLSLTKLQGDRKETIPPTLRRRNR